MDTSGSNSFQAYVAFQTGITHFKQGLPVIFYFAFFLVLPFS